MIKARIVVCCVLMVFTWESAFAQQPGGSSGESSKNRILFTIVGGAGGFAVGLFAGLAAFDDSPNSESKVTLTAALGGVGGAVGGYFLGRSFDKQSKKKVVTSLHPQYERPLGFRPDFYPPIESVLPGINRAATILRKGPTALPDSDLAARGPEPRSVAAIE